MSINKPNHLNKDFEIMEYKKQLNISYINKFKLEYNDDNNINSNSMYYYYYTNINGNWCIEFAHSFDKYLGNPWHCLTFILHLFSYQFVNYKSKNINYKSIYIINKTSAKNIKINSDKRMFGILMKPLITKFKIINNDIINNNNNNNEITYNLLNNFIILPHERTSINWGYHNNYKICNKSISPIIYAFKYYYYKYYILNIINKTKCIKEIINNKYFYIYYNHNYILRNNNNNNNNNNDYIYNLFNYKNISNFIFVSNRWKISNNNNNNNNNTNNTLFCRRRCIINYMELMFKISKLFNGIIIYGNPELLSFKTQLFLFTSINIYIGMHGGSFALTLFMRPDIFNLINNNNNNFKKYLMFEILPTFKNNKGRSSEHYAKFGGICYKNKLVSLNENKPYKLDINSTINELKMSINDCNMK